MLPLVAVKRHGKGVSERGEKVGGQFAPTAVADTPAGAGAGLSLDGDGRSDGGRVWEAMNRPGVSHTRVSSLALRIKDSAETALRDDDLADIDSRGKYQAIVGVCDDAYRAELRELLLQDDKSEDLVLAAEGRWREDSDEYRAAAACWHEPPEKYRDAVDDWKDALDGYREAMNYLDRSSDEYYDAVNRWHETCEIYSEGDLRDFEYKVDETREALHWVDLASFGDEDTVDLEGAILRHWQNATGEPGDEAVRSGVAADVNALKDIAAAGAEAGGLEDIAAAVEKVRTDRSSERVRASIALGLVGLPNEEGEAPEAPPPDDDGESFDSRMKSKIVERGHLTAEELDDSKGRGRIRFMDRRGVRG